MSPAEQLSRGDLALGRHTSPPPKIAWDEYSDPSEPFDEFLGENPAQFTDGEIRQGSACGEGGCE